MLDTNNQWFAIFFQVWSALSADIINIWLKLDWIHSAKIKWKFGSMIVVYSVTNLSENTLLFHWRLQFSTQHQRSQLHRWNFLPFAIGKSEKFVNACLLRALLSFANSHATFENQNGANLDQDLWDLNEILKQASWTLAMGYLSWPCDANVSQCSHNSLLMGFGE